MSRRAVAAALVGAVAAATTGCGSSSGDVATGAGAAGAAGGAIAIRAPRDGQRLRARATSGAGLEAPVRVRGVARPGSTVFINAGCRPQPCRAQIRADGGGAWAVTLRLVVPRAARFATIDVSGQRDVVAAGAAVATVELVGPAVVRPRAAASRTRAPASAARRKSAASARGAGAGARAGSPATAGAVEPNRRALAHDVLVIGDSLAVGMAPYLRADLPGWRVRIDARTSRPLAEGMGVLGADSSPPAVLAFSLFTNDDPRTTRALTAAVRATATRPGGCAVWSTIVRPPYGGVSYAAANTLLRGLAADPRLAPHLELVDWAAAVARAPSLVGAGDGVHATPAGYRERARLYAAAIESCAGGA